MSNVGQRERKTQSRVVKRFKDLGYTYLGDWEEQERTGSVEEDRLVSWLQQQGVSEILIGRALRQFYNAAALGEGKNSTTPIRKSIACCVMALKIKKVRVSRSKPSG